MKRVNVNIRDCTYTLLEDYSKKNEYSIARAIDTIIYDRLSYLQDAKLKAKKDLMKSVKSPQEWFNDFWQKALEEGENQK